MGMEAHVIAIGKFRKSLNCFLDYPIGHYEDVKEGVTIVTTIFRCVTSESSRALAEALGTEAWSLGEHHINPFLVNLAELEEMSGEGGLSNRNLMDFVRLREAGFDFYYRPNG